MFRLQFLFLFLCITLAACARQELPVTPTRPFVAAAPSAEPTSSPSSTALPGTPTSSPAAAPRDTRTPTPSRTPFTLPPSATPSPTVTLRPATGAWVMAGTAIPPSREVITAARAAEISELARWGRGVITDIDLSADGRFLAVAAGAAVFIHDAADLAVEPQVIQAPGHVSAVALAPSGDRVALAVSGPEVQVWQVASAEKLFTLADMWAPQFSPDGRALAALTAETVEVWDGAGDTHLASFAAGQLPRFRFAPHADQIAVWSISSNPVTFYDWSSGRLLSESEPTGHRQDAMTDQYHLYAGDVAFVGEDELRLLTLEDQGYVRMSGRIEVQEGDGTLLFAAGPIDYLTGAFKYVCNEPVYYWDPPERPLPHHMEQTANGQITAMRYEEAPYSGDFAEYSSLRFYRSAGGELLYALEEGIVDFELAPDGLTWVAGRQDGRLQVRRTSDGAVLQSIDAYESPVLDLRVSPTDEWLGVVYEDEVKVLRAADGAAVYRYPARRIAFAPDQTSFALAYASGDIEIRSLADGSLRNAVAGHTDRITDIIYLPSGELLSAGFDCAITLWELPGLGRRSTWANVFITGGVSGDQVPVRVDDFLLLPDTGSVIGRFFFRNFAVWNAAEGSLLRALQGAEEPEEVLAAAPTGDMLAVSTYYPPDPWDEAIDFVGTSLEPVAFAPAGDLLAGMTSWQRALELWQVSPLQLLDAFDPGGDSTTAVLFTHDGRTLLTAADGIIQVWGLP